MTLLLANQFFNNPSHFSFHFSNLTPVPGQSPLERPAARGCFSPQSTRPAAASGPGGWHRTRRCAGPAPCGPDRPRCAGCS